MLKLNTDKSLKVIKKIITLFTAAMLLTAIVFLFIGKNPDRKGRLIFTIGQLLLMMVIIILPEQLKERIGLKIPLLLETTLTVFAFCGFVLGDVFDFYGKISVWDSILHAFSGIVLSYVGIVLLEFFVKKDNVNISMGNIWICISVVLFSLSLGALWEIGEYLVDDVFKTNNQQYMKTTRGTLYKTTDEPLVGHEALADTMKDLMLDLAGATAVATISFCKEDYKRKKNKRTIED